MKRLVYLSPVPWSSFAQRPHKFVEWFHASSGGEVLWVEPYPTRFPLLSDFFRFSSKSSQENAATPSWLSVIKPFVLPLEPLPGSYWLNVLMWRPIFKEVKVFSSRQDCLLAIGKPSVLALAILHRTKGCLSVYDAMDDFPAFYAGFSRWSMRRREKHLVNSVSRILASSTVIRNRWRVARTDVQLVHNGLDASLLPELRSNLVKKKKKVLGYVGTIATWFDWGWVIELAKTCPDCVVRLIGPVFSLVQIDLPINIEMRPPCSHQAAILAMQEFDVGLIPFLKNDLTASVDPIKYYEYRALGLPVISTDFGEMAFRGEQDGTFLSHGSLDIASLVERALLYTADIESIRTFREDNSWEARFVAAKI